MEKRHITLTSVERDYLQELLSKGTVAVKTYKRGQALLNLHEGKSLQAAAQRAGVSYLTVSKWRNGYRQTGLSMLYDQQRPGRPIEIDGEQRAKITALACSQAPEGHRRWTLRLLADKVVELSYCEHLSYAYAGEILKKTN